MNKSLLLISGITLLGLSLTGCGSSDSGKKLSSSSSSSSSVVSSSSASSESSSSVSTWELVWSDEFDGAAIDDTKWTHERNCTGGGNNELQCYTDRSENSFVSDGKLHIVARKEVFSGPAKNDDEPGYSISDTSATRDYTSARLRSKNKGDWKYGRMEINAKLPDGQGIWPAIWMLPTEWVYGGWPASGELDILEAVNLNTLANGKLIKEVHGTLHFGRFWPNNNYVGDSYTPTDNAWENFLTYAVEWEEDEIRWYVNDHHYATQTSDGWFTYYWDDKSESFTSGNSAAPFDQTFHLLLNLAVGGNWPQSPNEQTSFPKVMLVDYVRVYRCSLAPDTGKGCASHINPDVVPQVGVPAPAQVNTSLYDNGASTLNFNVAGELISNTLVPGYYDGGNAGNVVSNPAYTLGDSLVWDIMFNATPGNAFLSSGDMSAIPGVHNGFKFTNMAEYGELKFDLLVEAIDPETELLIKLDSGWPNVSYQSISIPPIGEWTSIAIPFSQLLPNNIQLGQVDMSAVVNPFVIEPSAGSAHVKLKNIHLVCLAECGVAPILAGTSAVLNETFPIYVAGDVGPNWDFGLGKWDNDSGHVTVSEANDAERGEVINITFSASTSDNGLAFIQSTTPKDGSAFSASGYLEFDIKVISYGSNSAGLVVKAESGPSQGTGDYIITPAPTVGVWTTVKITLADMLAHSGNSGFNITAFNTPFVFLPAWGDQSGVEVQLDNIRWVIP